MPEGKKVLKYFKTFFLLVLFLSQIFFTEVKAFTDTNSTSALTPGNFICFKISPEILKDFVKKVNSELKGRVPESYIKKIFFSESLCYFPQVMIKWLTWKEKELPYYQFLEPDRIKRAREFMKEHITLLSSLEEKFGVEKEVLTAIFLVETNLGKITGKYPVFDVLFSMAISGNQTLFSKFAKKFNFKPGSSDLKKLEFRSRWAYRELLSFIKISYKNRWNIFEIKGSIFGAFGYPQFVPRSYLTYGYDWDKDGIIDLYTLGDALASIANYLKKEGYKKNLPFSEKKKIIMKYNISEPYAETVLKIAKILKNKN
jgi:membrane-bound lytic murein transglycosylase B